MHICIYNFRLLYLYGCIKLLIIVKYYHGLVNKTPVINVTILIKVSLFLELMIAFLELFKAYQ